MNPPPQTIRRPYRVVSNIEIAKGILQVILEPVNPDNRIPPFEAGQWVSLHLLNENGSVWAKCPYSVANAPQEVERDTRIELGIKVFGDFTKRVQTLKAGDVADLQGPFGAFTLAPSPRAVFFAGGIGITPIRSMIRHARYAYPSMDATLFYSVRDVAQSVYGEEFERLAAEWGSFRLITKSPCVADPNEPGGFGGVDEAFLDRTIGEYAHTEYYLCGPKDFMDKLTAFLHTRGVDSASIHQERFS